MKFWMEETTEYLTVSFMRYFAICQDLGISSVGSLTELLSPAS